MFTGIVEEVGRIDRVAGRGEIVVVDVGAGVVTSDLRVGDSVAVDGVCLTAVAVRPDGFTVELAPETVRRTTLGDVAAGDAVNLERPIAPAGRMGGHFVQGHIDGTGRVVSLSPEGEAMLVRFHAPPEVMRYVVPKGFIAIDGVSLTVVDLDAGAGTFRISYIPHTLAHTTARAYAPGRAVNFEPDILGKYVERFLAGRASIEDDLRPESAADSSRGTISHMHSEPHMHNEASP